MTAPVPDPREDIDWSQHRGSCRVFYAERRCTCAAVPDPRFRDQLAEAAAGLLYPGLYPSEAIRRHPAQIERVAAHLAEVEARVQAAANQRAAEAVKALRGLADEWRRQGAVRDFGLSLTEAGNRIDTELNVALASPAPAPRAEPPVGDHQHMHTACPWGDS